MNYSITPVLVEQPQAMPGSAKDLSHVTIPYPIVQRCKMIGALSHLARAADRCAVFRHYPAQFDRLYEAESVNGTGGDARESGGLNLVIT